MNHIYDVLILGGGPAGYTAALYCARAGLDTLVVEQLCAGGQMALTFQIDNYPGFDEGVDGYALGEKMQRGAQRFGAKTEMAEVFSADLAAPVKALHTSGGDLFGRSAILATGARPRKLGLPGEDAFLGRGVHYCASCDGMAYRGKTAAVAGGGNSAAADALLLSRVCEKVHLIHRRGTLRADAASAKALAAAPNVELHLGYTISGITADGGRFTGVTLQDVNNGAQLALPCGALFVSIGREPVTELFAGQVELAPGGYIAADETTRTSLPGVFAAGDVRTKAVRQIVTAAADGAVAAHYAAEYLAGV